MFIQNNGMAFGWEMGSKLMLTILRIITVGFLIFYLFRTHARKEASTGYLMCLALIAGAAGNIIDCVFYGVVFSNPAPPALATMFPDGGGIWNPMHGLVVDMFISRYANGTGLIGCRGSGRAFYLLPAGV